MATQDGTFVEKRQGDSLVNVVLGAAVALVASFVAPAVGQVLGGGVTGYLQAGERMEGAKLGALAAAISAIPATLLVVLVFGFGVLGLAFGADAGAGIVFLLLIVAGVVIGLAVAAALGAVGGYAGAAVAED